MAKHASMIRCLANVALAALLLSSAPGGPAPARADASDCFTAEVRYWVVYDSVYDTYWDVTSPFYLHSFSIEGAYEDGGSPSRGDREEHADGSWTETMTLAGANGTLEIELTLAPSWGFVPTAAGTFTVLSGTGDYAGLEAEGSAIRYVNSPWPWGVGSPYVMSYWLDSCPDANRSPTVSLSASPATGQVPLDVTLTASAYDADGSIVKYEWDIDGDGTYETDTGTTATLDVKYETAGTYNPAVRVTDDDGASGWDYGTVVVYPPPAVTLFADGFEGGCLGAGSATGGAAVTSENSPYEGYYHLEIARQGSVSRTLDLAGTWALALAVAVKVESFGKKDQAALKVSPDGTTWTTLQTFHRAYSDGVYRLLQFDLSDLTPTADFRIALESQAIGRRAVIYLDAIEIIGQP